MHYIVSTASLLYWILNRPVECLYIHIHTVHLHTVKNSQWKACLHKVHSEELCNCKIKVSERDWFCFRIMSSCWSGWRCFSTSQTLSSPWGKGKIPKAESALTIFSSPCCSCPQPLPACSPPLTHILFLLSLLYCFHPFLV